MYRSKFVFNLQNHPTVHSEERLVNLVRGREHFVGLSLLPGICLLFAGNKHDLDQPILVLL